MRRAHLVSALVLMVTILPLVPGGASAAGGGGRRGDAALPGTTDRGTGVLPNFGANGSNLIRLQSGAFDPLSDPLPGQGGIPTLHAGSLALSATQYWLVQVDGDDAGDLGQAIEASGAQVMGYVPERTLAVRATVAQHASFASHEAIRWSGLYQPAWRVPVAAAGKPALLDLDGSRTYRVYLFRDDPTLHQVAQAVDAVPGVETVGAGGTVIDVRATAAEIPAIAAIPGVEWIGAPPKGELHNYNARWVTDTGIRDLFAATAPNDTTPPRLNGAGQTAAVADTGLNYTYDLNGRAHIAFRDCDSDGTNCKEAKYKQTNAGSSVANLEGITVANPGGHRKMVAYFDLGDTGPNMYDESSHGTHTAGSVDGDRPDYGEYNGEDGIAPAANHVHQNIATEAGGLVLPGGLLFPEDLYYLFAQAYRPRDPASVSDTSGDTGNPDDYSTAGDYVPLEDARTHNNSWGAIYPIADEGHGFAVDRFVWDHEDMSIVFSAGNAGPSAASISSPTTAKNDFTSGASANGRQPMASIDSMAQFSSHGPAGDGRFGVDLATPGQIVVSAKGGSTDEYHVAQGTSMSAPVLTGLTTLVRQYFFDGYAAAGGDGFAAGVPDGGRQHNPSAALVKAAMVNGAVRMRGWYTGDEGSQRGLDGQWPSAGQGFGRVNLDNSLYFGGDPTNNWYVDVYRGDTDAAATCVLAGGADDTQCTAFTEGGPQTRTFPLDVDAGQPLDVTLNWTDAPNLIPAGTPSLVNNLDLMVEGPSGQMYVGNNMNTRTSPNANPATTPNAAAPPDTLNPTERVRVAQVPEDGTYTITVSTQEILPGNGNQGFALAASGDIQPVGGGFTPGGPAQEDVPGSPGFVADSDRVDPHSSDTAVLSFETDEPTTAVANAPVQSGGTSNFVDSYNESNPDAFPGLNEGPVETSGEYADKAVVGTHHEILMTGLPPGSNAVQVEIEDLDGNTTSDTFTVVTPGSTFGADAPDIQYCIDGEPDCEEGSDTFATQIYAGTFGGSNYLGAWMFRVPESEIDPADITGAVVETYSTHDWANNYDQDPYLRVDLLDESVEADWSAQDYQSIHSAPMLARAYPETTDREGDYQRYAWTFQCSDLEALRQTLEETNSEDERLAAFRYEAQPMTAGIFGFDFGFNRRSRGPDARPRLILLTDGDPYDAVGECDPGTPAPTISKIGVREGIGDGTATVSWRTDVPSSSIVFFREQGTTEWTQVGTPALTTLHQVEVLGLNEEVDYEFTVRSEACNGATSDDTNGGEGYGFFREEASLGTRTEVAAYDWESGTEGWTVASNHGAPPDSDWERRSPGASDTVNAEGARPEDPSKQGWHLEPYFDEDESHLISPPVTFPGQSAGVEFWLARDTEDTFDFLHVDYSTNGTDWTNAASYDGINEHWPAFELESTTFTNPTPGGALQIRFRFKSDELVSAPLYNGVSLDKVALASYPDLASGGGEQVPLTGPAPPPSAEGTDVGATLPATRTMPLARDLAAGTGMCGGAGVPDVTITEPEDGAEVSAGNLLVRGTASYGGGTPEVRVRAFAPGFDTGSQTAATGNGFQDWNHVVDLSGQEGKTVTIRSTLLLDGAAVDTDEILVVVGAGGGGGDGSGGGPRCPGYRDESANHIVGTPADDVLIGTNGRDVICGLAGDDVLRGMKGGDILLGGAGNDRLRGDQGADLLLGSAGNDALGGGRGADDIRGGGGDDDLRGRRKNDDLRGGGGDDNLRGGGGRDLLRGGGGDDLLFGGTHNDTLSGGGSRDSCDGGRGRTLYKGCEQRSQR